MEFRGAAPVDFETPTFVPGRKGLNWFATGDKLDPEEALYRRNIIQQRQGEMALRPGQQTAFSVGASINAIARMDLPGSASFIRYWGGGSSWLRGNGAPAVLEAGFSGSPLTLTPYRPALSGQPWMIAADSAKLRQASATGPSMEMGLPAPGTAAVAEITDLLTTGISAFDGSDSTAAANWVYTAGVDRSATPIGGGVPNGTDVTGLSGSAVEFTTNVGGALTGYSSLLGRAKAMDLTKLQGGTVDAGPDDIVHLWLKVSRPAYLEEVRVYFICSTFDPAVLPGADGTVNTDGFVKAIRGSDITGFLENLESSTEAGDRTRTTELVNEFLDENNLRGFDTDTITSVGGGAIVPPARTAGDTFTPTQTNVQLAAGRDVWTEFGNVGRTLRRADFARFGSTPGTGWDTITGIMLVIQTSANESIAVTCDDWFLMGGYPLDASEPTASPYDWRYTNYHLETGDEGNPSPEMDDTAYIVPIRQRVNVQPVGYGDPNVRQKFYRRGGSLPTDWYYSGMNTGDGALYTDEESDTTVVAAGTLALDNDQPVTTVNAVGTTVRAQPLPVVFGPLGGRLCGLGDPYRPGHLYFSKVEKGGSWPPQNALEVCAPSDELLMGTVIGGIGFMLSRKRGYQAAANLVNGEISVQDTACLVGCASRWAWAQSTRGVYFVSADSDAPGIYLSSGQAAQLLSQKIDPVFKGQRVEYAPGTFVLPVDWSQSEALRLSVFQNILWFNYTDTGGTRRILCFNLLTEEWYSYDFATAPRMTYAEEGLNQAPMLWLGCADGSAMLHTGTDDNTVAIAGRLVTGYQDQGRPREDKLLGDTIFDADLPGGTDLTLTTRLNNGALSNPASPWTSGASGRRRYQVDGFGTTPQRARNLQMDWAWSASAFSALYVAGTSVIPQPDQVLKRATSWESFPTEQYFWGMTMVCDTGGVDVTVAVEYTQGDNVALAALVTVTANDRSLLQFSWPAVKADQIRVRGTDDDCRFWMLYKLDWLLTKEPPRMAGWDSTFENLGDTYYTGLDLECDTFGVEKNIEVDVDGVLIENPATGGTTFPITANTRQVVHLTFGPGRGHIYRFRAVDSAPGLLYSRKWHVDEEPSEQANWNQNYTLAGTLTNKSVKGVLIECDTFGQDKVVRVEGDGSLITTLSVNHDGRLVQHYSFPAATARVLRLRPTDAFLSRPYSIQWIFDEEPLQLARWETQLVDHGLGGEHMLFAVQATLQSTVAVNLAVSCYNNSGVLVNTTTYAIPSTGGAKQKLYVKLQAFKGVLWKYVFTPVDSTTRFLLYREESTVLVLPWGATTPLTRQPFGSDDLDKLRQLGNASGIAATPNNAPAAPLQVTAGLMSGGDGVR